MKKLVISAVVAVSMVLGCMDEETTQGATASASSSTSGTGGSTATGAGGDPDPYRDLCKGKAAGDVCSGDAAADIHGECNANGVCEFQGWTCVHGKIGDTCPGGRCTKTAVVGANAECCNGCITTVGWCSHEFGQWGGNACK